MTMLNRPVVDQVIAHHSKSFSLASKLLSSDCRGNAVAVYAWCRRADDAVDLVDRGDATAALFRLREELTSIFSDEKQTDPILQAFQVVVKQRRLPRLYCDELLSGMGMDVDQNRYESFDELLLYCHRVAGVVGLLMCHVLGVRDDRALIHAAHLGTAMQLTNIARDVAEDWQRGRLYVPLNWLNADARNVISDCRGSLTRQHAECLRPAVRKLLDVAEQYYQSGDAGLGLLEPRSRWAIRTARSVYSEIGQVIRRSHENVLGGRARVSRTRKVTLAFACLHFSDVLDRLRPKYNLVQIPKKVLHFSEIPQFAPMNTC